MCVLAALPLDLNVWGSSLMSSSTMLPACTCATLLVHVIMLHTLLYACVCSSVLLVVGLVSTVAALTSLDLLHTSPSTSLAALSGGLGHSTGVFSGCFMSACLLVDSCWCPGVAVMWVAASCAPCTCAGLASSGSKFGAAVELCLLHWLVGHAVCLLVL